MRPDQALYVNAASAGVAGDMLLGALVDAGASPDAVSTTLAGLGIGGYSLSFERVQRAGVAATRAVVTVEDDAGDDDRHGHAHRPAGEVARLVRDADVPDGVRDRALRVVRALAEAEGAVHDIDPDDVVLHEVGSLDAIVDIVGVAAALDELGVAALHASPIAVGHGSLQAVHGVLPNPPPAVVHLLAGRQVPITGLDTEMELSTPTGVAILVALADAFGPFPAMTVDAVGYGAGAADPPGRPNVVQAVLGQATRDDRTGRRPGRAAVQLEVNVDDITGEVVAHTVAALLASGAHDAWATPIVMKKGRPAHTISALADPAHVHTLAAVLLAETGSLGLRAFDVERWPQQRHEVLVHVDGQPVRVKVAAGRAKVEHDDAAAAAAALDRPLRDVLRDAEVAARHAAPDPFGS